MGGKRQHYVPQCHLRQFRIGETDTIAIASLDPFRVVKVPGAINRQCYDDYFYGKDANFDEMLQETEKHMATLLRTINENGDLLGMQKYELGAVAVHLHTRTSKAAEEAKVPQLNIVTHVIRAAIESGKLSPPQDPADIDKWDFPGMPQFVTVNAIPLVFEMLTLECKLLRAPSGHFFITSDNPAVALNQLGYLQNPQRPRVGFANCGFQLILPIGPQYCACFYDPHVYKVGATRQKLVELSATDTEFVNGLQIVHAEECVYFNSLNGANTVAKLVARFSKFRKPIANVLKEYKIENSSDTLMHTQSPHPAMPLPWQFMKFRKRLRCDPSGRRFNAWTEAIQKGMEAFRRDPQGPSLLDRIEEYFLPSRQK